MQPQTALIMLIRKYQRGGKVPLFDMKCVKCGHIFEDYVVINNKPIICPICKKGKLKKLPPRVGIIFKGEGWTKRFH